jgi:hypothetical protein
MGTGVNSFAIFGRYALRQLFAVNSNSGGNDLPMLTHELFDSKSRSDQISFIFLFVAKSCQNSESDANFL